MRLTLRTLMAYRDGVLSTAETSDLHRRIKQSEVAGNLLRRIEAVVQRTQIVAPKVDGTGLGGDPNTVAEYLDDALPGEQVPEFERICIVESDVQLAELAHCHQLLADAMHSQVRVPQQLKALIVGLSDPANRQRLQERLTGESSTVEAVIVAEPQRPALNNSQQNFPQSTRKSAESGAYELRIDSAHSTPNGEVESVSERPQVQAPMVTSGGGSIKPQGLDLEGAQLAHEIPEYLVGSGVAGWRVPLAICAMVALLGFLGWQALGPLEDVRQLFSPQTPLASRDADTSSGAADSNVSGNDARSDSDARNDATGDSPAIPKDATANPRNVDANSKSIPAPVAPDRSNTGDMKSDSKDNDNAADRANSQPADSVNSVAASPASANTSVARAAVSNSSDKATEIPVVEPIANVGPQSPEVELPPAPRSKSIVWTPSDASEERAVLFARHLSPEGAFSLIRMAPRVAAASGAGIVVPPATRATLDLAGGCQWMVCGPTQLQASLAAEEETLVLSPLCKALVKTGTHGNIIRIATPAGSVAAQFLDRTSMAGIEVTYRPVASGLVSDRRAYKPLLIIVAVEGEVAVLYQDQKQPREQKLAIGDGLALIDGVPRLFKLGEIPEWYRGANGRPLDEQAAVDLHRQLQPGAEVGDGLLRMCSNRRPETAALAIQSSMLLGDWNAFASGFLANEAMRSHWAPTLALTEQMIASDPGNGEALQAALVAIDPARGKALFDLINGIPEDEQPSAFLPRLIDLLESPELDERVLAFSHLRRLTSKDFGYQPQAVNRASVQQWRRELAASRLKLNIIGDPLREAK